MGFLLGVSMFGCVLGSDDGLVEVGREDAFGSSFRREAGQVKYARDRHGYGTRVVRRACAYGLGRGRIKK